MVPFSFSSVGAVSAYDSEIYVDGKSSFGSNSAVEEGGEKGHTKGWTIFSYVGMYPMRLKPVGPTVEENPWIKRTLTEGLGLGCEK